MPPKFSTYFSFSDFNGGTRASFEQFHAELSQFNGPAVVYLCGVMNSVITDWQGHYHADAHEELVRNSFAPPFAERIIAEGGILRIRAVCTTDGNFCSCPNRQFSCVRKTEEKTPASLPTAARWAVSCSWQTISCPKV